MNDIINISGIVCCALGVMAVLAALLLTIQDRRSKK
jgi:hypothetical protein